MYSFTILAAVLFPKSALSFATSQQRHNLLSKHCVLHVQVGLFGICDEKLGAICVGSIICH